MFSRRQVWLAGCLVLVFFVVSGTVSLGQDNAGKVPGLSQRYIYPKEGGGTSYKFLGSKKTKEYHWPVCKLAQSIQPEDRITFKSAREAQAAGYVHCKVCSKFRF